MAHPADSKMPVSCLIPICLSRSPPTHCTAGWYNPKYLNSATNEYFKKGTILFGADEATKESGRLGQTIVVEVS